MIDLKKLETLFGMPETAALIEDSEHTKIQNNDKTDGYKSPHIIDATNKTVKEIIDSLSFCQFRGLTTFDEGAKCGYESDREMADKVAASQYYIIIRNVDRLSQSHEKWDDLINIIKDIRNNDVVQFPDSCLIVLTKNDLSTPILELDAYCTPCIIE